MLNCFFKKDKSQFFPKKLTLQQRGSLHAAIMSMANYTLPWICVNSNKMKDQSTLEENLENKYI